MATDQERLIVALEARIRDFERNMLKASRSGAKAFDEIEARAQKSASRLEQTLAGAASRVGSSFKSFGVGFLGGLTAGGLEGIVSSIGNIAKGMAEVGDQAQRAGLSTKAFQELAYVAKANRIDVDALTDGMKELSLRADEFIQTGTGAAAESFQRLGYTATELKEKLKDPSALFTQIIGKLQKLDKAAQIRIADELFGGTGGEQFVQLIAQGETGIRKLIQAAHDTGSVMDDEMIAKAAVLDRKFQALTSTVGNGLKQAIVEAASALSDFIERFGKLAPNVAALGGPGAGQVSMPSSPAGFLPSAAALGGETQGEDLARQRATILNELATKQALYNRQSDSPTSERMKALQAEIDAARQKLRVVEDQIAAQKRLNEEKEQTVQLDEVTVTDPKPSTGGPARYRQRFDPGLPASPNLDIEHRPSDLDRDPPDTGTASKAGVEAGESLATTFIKKFEGFIPRAKYDVNHYRVGYGSDTTTRADGRVETVTASTFVTLADANRDLARRIIDFQSGIRGKIGADTFNSFSEEQQAALTSIAYNYGELPDRIVAAIRAGSPEGVGTAIRDLGDDNGGINRKRRAEEADLFFSGSGSGATPAMTDATTSLQRQETAAAALEDRYQSLGQIGATAFQGIANALSDGNLDAGELLSIVGQLIQQLLQMPSLKDGSLFSGASGGDGADPWAGMRSGTGGGFFGKLLGSLLGFSDGGYTGQGGKHEPAGIVHKGEVVWSQKDVARAGGVRTVEAMRAGDVANVSEDDGGRSHGRPASDASANRRPSGEPVAHSRPIPAFADGGHVRGPGGPREDRIPAMLSNGEFVVNAQATQRYRHLLEAINGGSVPRLAKGGAVGSIARPASTSVSYSPTINVKVDGGSSGDTAKDQAFAKDIAKQIDTQFDQRASGWALNQMRPGGVFKKKELSA